MSSFMDKLILQETTGYKPVDYFNEVFDILKRHDSLVFYDLETTGLGAKDKIIQFYGARYSIPDFNLMEEKEIYIKQNDLLSPEIVALTGVTDEFLDENGLDEEDAFMEISSFIQPDDLLMGHNIDSFDRRFMEALYADYDSEFKYQDSLDTLKVAKKVVAPRRVNVFPKALRKDIHDLIENGDPDQQAAVMELVDELFYTESYSVFIKKIEKKVSQLGIEADYDAFEQAAESHKKKKPSYTNGILFHLYYPDVKTDFHNAALDVKANVAVFIAMLKEMKQAIEFDNKTANSEFSDRAFKIINVTNYESPSTHGSAAIKQTYVMTSPCGLFFYDADNLEWRAKEGEGSMDSINMRELRTRVLKMTGASDEADLFKKVKKLEKIKAS